MTDDDQKKSLPDFLNERISFEVLLRVSTDLTTGVSTLTHCPKYVLIEEFQPNSKGKKETTKVTAGYEQYVK